MARVIKIINNEREFIKFNLRFLDESIEKIVGCSYQKWLIVQQITSRNPFDGIRLMGNMPVSNKWEKVQWYQ